MLALVLAMLLCVALGAGVVGYVMLEARREGRGDFWTAEGEELIAGARRTGEKVRSRGEELGRSAAARTRAMRDRRRADDDESMPAQDAMPGAPREEAEAPGADAARETGAAHDTDDAVGDDQDAGRSSGEFRAAS